MEPTPRRRLKQSPPQAIQQPKIHADTEEMWRVVKKLAERKYGTLRGAFSAWNVNSRRGDRTLDAAEFRKGLNSLGCGQWTAALLQALDKDGSGDVSREEFVAKITALYHDESTQTEGDQQASQRALQAAYVASIITPLITHEGTSRSHISTLEATTLHLLHLHSTHATTTASFHTTRATYLSRSEFCSRMQIVTLERHGFAAVSTGFLDGYRRVAAEADGVKLQSEIEEVLKELESIKGWR